MPESSGSGRASPTRHRCPSACARASVPPAALLCACVKLVPSVYSSRARAPTRVRSVYSYCRMCAQVKMSKSNDYYPGARPPASCFLLLRVFTFHIVTST